MHEMGIAVQIMEAAIAAIPPDMENNEVESINLRIGKLAAVIPESLNFCFNIIKQDTRLANANLKIEEIPVQAQCKACHHTWTIAESVFICPNCRHGSIHILSGRELEIISLEIAD